MMSTKTSAKTSVAEWDSSSWVTMSLLVGAIASSRGLLCCYISVAVLSSRGAAAYVCSDDEQLAEVISANVISAAEKCEGGVWKGFRSILDMSKKPRPKVSDYSPPSPSSCDRADLVDPTT
eukprot:scaffold81379_cov32-Prasinocladus_malaysianus.AAC.1